MNECVMQGMSQVKMMLTNVTSLIEACKVTVPPAMNEDGFSLIKIGEKS